MQALLIKHHVISKMRCPGQMAFSPRLERGLDAMHVACARRFDCGLSPSLPIGKTQSSADCDNETTVIDFAIQLTILLALRPQQ